MNYPIGPLLGDLNNQGALTGKLSGGGTLSGGLSTQVGVAPLYDGPYEVTPRFVEQMLQTNGKTMGDDVTVHAIAVVETTNIHGGKTVVIGN